MGQIPYIVFLPRPSIIAASIDTTNDFHGSAQVFIKELHTERFTPKVTKLFKGIGTHSIRDVIIDAINTEFEKVYNETKDIQKAIVAVDSLGISLSVLENSEMSEFKISNLHISILELAKDLSEDRNISEIVIVCNCEDKKPILESKNELINGIKSKNGGTTNYNYDFKVKNTDELMSEYNDLLTKH